MTKLQVYWVRTLRQPPWEMALLVMATAMTETPGWGSYFEVVPVGVVVLTFIFTPW
jgi:hypothetical protein